MSDAGRPRREVPAYLRSGRERAGGLGSQGADSGGGPWSVTRLIREVGSRLEGVGSVAVEGEVSGLKRASSGHVYFDLQDERARVSCAIWRNAFERAVRFRLAEGVRVVAHGKLDVYAPRGSMSLIVQRLEPAGEGVRLAELERLKAELRERGWFERARPIPEFPACVGIVTSRDGAALRDVLRTRSLRYPAYPVRLVHTAVQGPGASASIARAIEMLGGSGVDVVLVCRGGGSLEDLWAFNELPVAEAVWRCPVPVISGVGHESDVTLCDFVADVRAHTPTDAAQVAIPDRRAFEAQLERARRWLAQAIDSALERRGERLRRLAASPYLRDPARHLEERGRRLRDQGERLHFAVRGLARDRRSKVELLGQRLARTSPERRLGESTARLESLAARMRVAVSRHHERARARHTLLAERLEARSPVAVLARGYSLTTRAGKPAPIHGATELSPGDLVETRLARGRFVSRVESIDAESGED